MLVNISGSTRLCWPNAKPQTHMMVRVWSTSGPAGR